MEFAASGALGKCLVAKAWESSKQGAIGFPPDSTPPSGVDYDMWLGPARQRAFNKNRFHGRWRWFYDYGTGDLGNDGVHRLDMAVAVINAACQAQGDEPLGIPRTICANGGKWYFEDAQEFPDTLQVNYEFGAGQRRKLLTYEMRIWSPYNYLTQSEGSAVFGDQGYLIIGNTEWVAYGRGGKELARGTGDSSEVPHVQNFIECVKSRSKPHCDLETVGHPASVLCHTGNIAARVGRSLTFDAATETFVGDSEANALRTRAEYRRPWGVAGGVAEWASGKWRERVARKPMKDRFDEDGFVVVREFLSRAQFSELVSELGTVHHRGSSHVTRRARVLWRPPQSRHAATAAAHGIGRLFSRVRAAPAVDGIGRTVAGRGSLLQRL